MADLKTHVNELIAAAAKTKDSADAMRFSQAALNITNALCTLDEIGARGPLDESVIKKMVDRFLWWSLPEDFHPDCGISYERRGKTLPAGTNLFTATQAEAMVRHMLEGLSSSA